MIHEETSTSLLEALRVGQDEDAWQRFCQRYEPMLRAVAGRAGLSPDGVADVVQEIMLTFMTSFREGKYDADRGRLRSWLRGIAMNKIHEARRKIARGGQQVVADGSETDLLHRIPDEQELTDIFEREWEREILAECFRRVRQEVSEQTFECFRLNAQEGWEPQRVAEHLGIERDAVYVHKNRVLSRLRRIREEITEDW